jgi:hypothetical protein
MSESQQTAVGWIEDNIQSDMTFMEIMGLIRQAKELEKEQIIDADLNATIRTAKGVNADVSVRRVRELAEQYYNEKYGK